MLTKKARPNTNDGGNVIMLSVYKQIRHRLNEWQKDLKDEEVELKQVNKEANNFIQVTPQARLLMANCNTYLLPPTK